MVRIARPGFEEDSLDRFLNFSSKRLCHRTTHPPRRANSCDRLSVPATAARGGEEALLTSSTSRNAGSSRAPTDGRKSRSNQGPRERLSLLGPASPNSAVVAAVPPKKHGTVGEEAPVPVPFAVLDRRAFPSQLIEAWAPSEAPASPDEAGERHGGHYLQRKFR